MPYLTGERCPHYRTDLCASMTGLTLDHTPAHMARAALEAVAYCIRDVADCVGLTDPIHLTGGVTRYPAWTQILADVLGQALHSVSHADASAIGAAMLAHQAMGRTIDPVAADHVISPVAANCATYDRLYAQWRERAGLVGDSIRPDRVTQ